MTTTKVSRDRLLTWGRFYDGWQGGYASDGNDYAMTAKDKVDVDKHIYGCYICRSAVFYR